MSTFKRYTEASRRAIFFAREAALNANKSEVDSICLLSALLLEKQARSNVVFKLDEKMSQEAARMRAMVRATKQRNLPLDYHTERILAYSLEEANAADQYWIDTDHLVLGILRESDSPAATQLQSLGLGIEKARTMVASATRDPGAYGPVPALWQLSKPTSRVGHVSAMFYLLFVVILIKFLTGTGC